VPFGTLVGEHSFQTLDAFYTGYGEIGAFGGKAPDPHRISASSTEEEEEESSGDEYLLNNYPQLDYIQSCALTWQSNWTSSNRDEHSSSSSRENSDYNSVVPSSTTPVATTKATTTPRALPDVAPSPSLPLPRYNPNLPWPPSMSNEREASFFWWLDPLKQAILKLQDEEKASGRLKEARREVASEGESPSSSSSSSPSLLDDDGQRQILRPGEVHSVKIHVLPLLCYFLLFSIFTPIMSRISSSFRIRKHVDLIEFGGSVWSSLHFCMFLMCAFTYDDTNMIL